MVDIDLENGFISVSIYGMDDKELDFSMWDHRSRDNAHRFQTLLTKKDAKRILRVLDRWVSNQPLEL